MAPHDLFAATSHHWAPRPGDPNDVFVAQVIQPDAPRPDQPPGGVGLFGVPFDGAVPGRPGAREGPDAIRQQMARLKPWTLRGGALDSTIFDWGNVKLDLGDINAAHQRTESAALAVLEAGQFPLALGGDHSISFPLVKAHEGRVEKLGVINLDAHLDVRDVVEGRLNSGQSFRRLMDIGLVPADNLVEIGIRDFANSAAYAERARSDGATVFGAEEWRRDGTALIEHAMEIASRDVDAVYLSIDIDVLDQAHAPGVSAPTPGGVDTTALFAAVRHIAQFTPLIGADIVETAPPLDRDNMTSRAAAYCAMHLLAGLGMREA